MSSVATCQGMPGGSWAFDEEGPTSCFQVPNGGVQDLNPVEDAAQCAVPVEKLQTPQTVHSEIVTIDPAILSEEIVLVASPTSTTSKETWRVRISPEYDIQVLPPESHERDVLTPRIRDSPQQRRSRHLDMIFPEFQDYIHSASRSSTSNIPVPSVLDIEWDFLQHDTSAANGGPSDAGGREEPNSDSLPDCGGFGVLGLHLLPHSVDKGPCDETSGSEPASGISDLSAPGHHTDESSLDSVIDSSTQSSLSAPESVYTPSSVLSTARPSPLPVSLRSTLRTDAAEAASSGGRNTDDAKSHSVEETARESLMLTPTSLADHDGSESLHSMILRPAPSPVLSEDGMDNERGSTYELEYLDEELYPALTPLRLGLDDISLPLSLDSFGLPNDWELVVPLPHYPFSSSSGSPGDDSFFNGASGPLPEVHTSPEGTLGDEVLEETATPSESLPTRALTIVDEIDQPAAPPPVNMSIALENGTDSVGDESAAARSELQGNGALALEDEMDNVADDLAATPSEPQASVSITLANGTENVVEEHISPPSSSDSSSDSQFDNVEPTLELPVLDLRTPALSDFWREDSSADGALHTLPEDPPRVSLAGLLGEVHAEAAGPFRSSGYSDPPSSMDNVGDEPPASPPYSSIDSENQSDNEPTPERLPTLDFDMSSLTDSVLRSPEFHAAGFGEYSPEIEGVVRVSILTLTAAPAPRSKFRHARSFSASNVERTSILWAPYTTKYLYEPVKGPSAKAKGKARARSVSEEGERVEQEVQTESADDLRARYTRLKKELKEEREHARLAALSLAETRSRVLEWEREAMLMANVYLPGALANWEDGIM